MFNKWFKYMGKTFFVFFFFLALGFSDSWAINSQNNRVLMAKESGFTSQVDKVVLAQDMTIKLEKKATNKNEWPNYLKEAGGAEDKELLVQELTIKKDVTIKLKKEIPSTYEEMEDPFAGAEEDLPVLSDPLEGYNRWMFGINEAFYEHAMEPFVTGYRNTVNEELRIGIRNVYNNATAPAKLISSLFQLEFGKAGRVLARTFINTAFGFFGYADVASEEFGFDDVNEDFDQALGSLGIPTGPYIVLPFFGPATARNIVGRAVDTLSSPGAFTGQGFGTNVIINAEDQVNQASFILDDKKQLEESALDEYESVRDFYHQFRHGLLKN
tara:strand:- start:40 stop:1020 length:981 start_codon:yes stop_codon:yes gene_type:complete